MKEANIYYGKVIEGRWRLSWTLGPGQSATRFVVGDPMAEKMLGATLADFLKPSSAVETKVEVTATMKPEAKAEAKPEPVAKATKAKKK